MSLFAKLPQSSTDLSTSDFPDFPKYWIASKDPTKVEQYKRSVLKRTWVTQPGGDHDSTNDVAQVLQTMNSEGNTFDVIGQSKTDCEIKHIDDTRMV